MDYEEAAEVVWRAIAPVTKSKTIAIAEKFQEQARRIAQLEAQIPRWSNVEDDGWPEAWGGYLVKLRPSGTDVIGWRGRPDEWPFATHYTPLSDLLQLPGGPGLTPGE